MSVARRTLKRCRSRGNLRKKPFLSVCSIPKLPQEHLKDAVEGTLRLKRLLSQDSEEPRGSHVGDAQQHVPLYAKRSAVTVSSGKHFSAGVVETGLVGGTLHQKGRSLPRIAGVSVLWPGWGLQEEAGPGTEPRS